MIPSQSCLLQLLPPKNGYQSWESQEALIRTAPTLKNRILISDAKNTESLSALNGSLDFIYITDPPQQGLFLTELFGKVHRALKLEGKLCFILSKRMKSNVKILEKDITAATLRPLYFETIIYYGMKNGFLFLDNWTKRSISGKNHVSYIWFLKENSLAVLDIYE